MDNIQGRYSHCGQTWNEGSIRHTPSLIIITHHTSHSLNVCVRMCVCVYRPLDHCSFQENRQSLDLSLSSLLTWPLCDVRVQVCDHSSSRRNQSFSGNTLLRCINHQPLTILTCSKFSLAENADQRRGWHTAPFGVECQAAPGVHSASAEAQHSHTSTRSGPDVSSTYGSGDGKSTQWFNNLLKMCV